MLNLQSFKSRIVCLLIFKVHQDSLGDVILLASQGVSSTEVLEGLIVRRGGQCLALVILQVLLENLQVLLEIKIIL